MRGRRARQYRGREGYVILAFSRIYMKYLFLLSVPYHAWKTDMNPFHSQSWVPISWTDPNKDPIMDVDEKYS